MSRKPTPPEVRFWRMVDKAGECWEWTGGKNQKGYGLFKPVQPGKSYSVHRYSYELEVGPIPDGMQVDHRCRSRGCVRPAHLRIVTPAENSEHQAGHRGSASGRRGVSWSSASGKWLAKAMKAGKVYYAGFYDDIDRADEAARELRNQLMTHNDLDRRSA